MNIYDMFKPVYYMYIIIYHMTRYSLMKYFENIVNIILNRYRRIGYTYNIILFMITEIKFVIKIY